MSGSTTPGTAIAQIAPDHGVDLPEISHPGLPRPHAAKSLSATAFISRCPRSAWREPGTAPASDHVPTVIRLLKRRTLIRVHDGFPVARIIRPVQVSVTDIKKADILRLIEKLKSRADSRNSWHSCKPTSGPATGQPRPRHDAALQEKLRRHNSFRADTAARTQNRRSPITTGSAFSHYLVDSFANSTLSFEIAPALRPIIFGIPRLRASRHR